jgi:hypothetical protein
MSPANGNLPALLRLPLPPPSQQWEVKAKPYRSGIELAQHRGIPLQLPAITLLLAIQKGIQPPALVGAGLIVDDPADAVGIHEATIHDRRDRLAVLDERERVFAFGIAVLWVEQPGAFGVVQSKGRWAVPTLLL